MRSLGWLVTPCVAVAGCGRFGFSTSRDAARGDGAPPPPIDAPPDAAPDALVLGPCTRLALSDNFDDGVRASTWTLIQNNPVSVAETGGQLQITLASSGGAHYGGYDSAATVDFRGHCMFVTFVQVPTAEPMVEMNFSVRTATNTSVGWDFHGGVIDPFWNNGAFMSFGPITYNPAAHKVLQLREDAGRMTWQTSADGVNFTTLTSQPTPLDVSSVTVVLEAGTYGSAPSPGMAIYDDFNWP